MSKVDRSSPLPLWSQVESDLRNRIRNGEFEDAFPTDVSLVAEYDVSRHTIREAIRHLNKSGLLLRVRGRGTVINRAEFEQPLGGLYSLFRSVEASGVSQTSRVLENGVVEDREAADRLGVPPTTQLVFLERIRYAGDAPLAVDRAWLPYSIAAPIVDADFSRTALYDELERTTGIRPNEGWERLRPVLPSFTDRKHLELDRNDAAFFLQRLGRYNDRVIEWRTTTIRGDRYQFLADWSQHSSEGLRLNAAPTDD